MRRLDLRTYVPRRPDHLDVYACGPTVYAPVHLGNARPYVTFLLLARVARSRGMTTRVVYNLTDVNDKIDVAAAAAGVRPEVHAQRMIDAYVAATDALGQGRPDAEPRVTGAIGQITAMIEALVSGGHAYESNGDVFFDVTSDPAYGSLSGRSLTDLVSQGEDDEVTSRKHHPMDWVLWKGAKAHWAGHVFDSPWGPGRPGWHIECSAMSATLLGEGFDVHGGGVDLLFPHHEDEAAQSRCSHGVEQARAWLHNGMVTVGDAQGADDKMAKSDGSAFGLAVALDRWGPAAIVIWMLGAHYRQPLRFSSVLLDGAERRAGRLGARVRALDDGPLPEQARTHLADIDEALADDLNTPRALAALGRLLDEADGSGRAEVIGVLDLLGLGILTVEPLVEVGDDVRALADERTRARAAQDWPRADALREQLAGLGWQVTDEVGGSSLAPVPGYPGLGLPR